MHPQRSTPFAAFLLLAVAAACWPQAGFLSAPVEVQGHVRAQLISELASVNPGGTVRIGVLLRIDPGWHIYWLNPGQSGLATTVTWKLPAGWSAGSLLWPRPERFEEAGLVTYGYTGDVLLAVDLKAPAGLTPGSSVALGARTTWLACQVECTPGKADVALSLPVGAGRPAADARWAAAFARERSLLPVVDSSLRFEATRSGSVVTVLAHGWNGPVPQDALFMPGSQGLVDDAARQILSVSGDALRLDLKAQAGSGGSRSLQGLLLFTRAGSPAAVAVETRVSDASSPARLSLLLAVLLAFAGGVILNLMPCVLPVISLKVLAMVRDSAEEAPRRIASAFSFAGGVVASFLALGGALAALRAGGKLLGWGFQFQDPIVVSLTAMVFFLVGLNLFGTFEVGSLLSRLGGVGVAAAGRAKPGLRSFVNGVFAAAVATPCTAPFMGAALGFALSRPPAVALVVFAALGLGLGTPYVALAALPGLSRRLPRPGRWMETLRQLLGFPMMGAVVWMLFVFSALASPVDLVALVGALLTAAVGAWAWGRWGSASSSRGARILAGSLALLLVLGAAAFAGVRASAARPSSSAAPEAIASGWQTWSPALEADLRARGRPVFIDFTARWCLTCQVNEQVALRNPQVVRRMTDRGVAALRADWTDRDDQIAAALSSYGRAGVPLYVYYAPGARDASILPEILTPGIVLAALDSPPG